MARYRKIVAYKRVRKGKKRHHSRRQRRNRYGMFKFGFR